MGEPVQPQKLFGRYQEVSLLLLGFVLTSVGGGFIAQRFQKRSWEHQHLVEVCEGERDLRGKRVEAISDLMDKRLLRMRQLAWKLQKAHSLADVTDERRLNQEARDDWSMRINSNLAFVEKNFGIESRNAMEGEIASGFSKVFDEFNTEFTESKIDVARAKTIEQDIDTLNLAVYAFDDRLEKLLVESSNSCSTLP